MNLWGSFGPWSRCGSLFGLDHILLELSDSCYTRQNFVCRTQRTCRPVRRCRPFSSRAVLPNKYQRWLQATQYLSNFGDTISHSRNTRSNLGIHALAVSQKGVIKQYILSGHDQTGHISKIPNSHNISQPSLKGSTWLLVTACQEATEANFAMANLGHLVN